MKPHLFADEDLGAICEYSITYFMRSGFQRAPTRELLEDEFPFFFKRRQWPEDEYVLSILADKLKEKYRRTQATTVLREVAQEVQNDPNGAVQRAVNEFARIQFETASAQRLEVFSENYDTRVNDYADRALEDFRHGGIPLGWPEVTEETFGIKPRELCVFAGTPNTGKSWTMCQIALTAALAGIRVYFPNLENTHEMTMWRLDCLASGVPYKKYERGGLSRPEIERLREASERIRAMGDALVVDSPNSYGERTAFELYSRARHYGAELLVGDQLSWVTPRETYQGDKTKQMSEVIQDIKSLTKEAGIASVWAAQFNREAARSSRGPQMHQIAITSQIEQICDWIFALSATEDQRAEDVMTLRIIKARRSRLIGWLLDWELEMATRFSVRGVIGDG